MVLVLVVLLQWREKVHVKTMFALWWSLPLLDRSYWFPDWDDWLQWGSSLTS